jgi:leader peptidase (prepilin peptidase)/N-methyltransferase
VEFGTATLYTLLGYHFEPSAELGLAWLFAAILVVIFVIDLEHQIIPNAVVYPAIPLAFLVPWLTGSHDMISALIGAGVGIGLLLPIALVLPAGLGMGDVKLAVLIGVLVGFPAIFISLLVGIASGAVVAVVLLVTKRRKRRDALPLAPFLIFGLVVAAFWGQPILSWYLGG